MNRRGTEGTEVGEERKKILPLALPSASSAPLRFLFLSSFVLAACGGIAGGDRDATIASCEALCAVQAAAPGCDRATNACDAFCTADGMAFTEDCLVKAKLYYDCAAPLAYACPGGPDQPRTGDSTCADAETAYLGCKITGQ